MMLAQLSWPAIMPATRQSAGSSTPHAGCVCLDPDLEMDTGGIFPSYRTPAAEAFDQVLTSPGCGIGRAFAMEDSMLALHPDQLNPARACDDGTGGETGCRRHTRPADRQSRDRGVRV
jgi:hypothetical protein